MTIRLYTALAIAAFAIAIPAAAQSDQHSGAPSSQEPGGMGGMMGGRDMDGMMRGQGMGCMMGGGGMMGGAGNSMPHLPPGNEKLELQMHADMMKAMADILAKYAARMPDRK